MQVDWITVAAQIINFLVLVWLLQRFLYRPVIKAMDAREAQIAERLRAAEREQEMAIAEASRYREMQHDQENRREQLMREAQAESDGLRKSLQSDARQEVTALREEWLTDLAAEKTDFLADIRERSADAFSQMARRAFGDLAGEELEDQIIRRFAKVLHEIEGGELKKIRSLCARTGAQVAVRTGFDLSAKRRNEIMAAFRNVISEDVEIVFERSPELICGVELRVGGQLVRWSLDSFLDGMENDLREALEARIPVAKNTVTEEKDAP